MPVDYKALHGEFEIQAIVTDPPWYENCYVVRHSGTGQQIIIDPGSNAERISETVCANGGPVVEILLTHGHPDHIGAVRQLQDEFDIPCRAHEDEKKLLDGVAQFSRSALGVSVQVPKSYSFFKSGDAFSLGGAPFRAIPCPGHTPGGVTFVFGGFALTGDTLFNHGIGRTDLPGGNGRALVASIGALLNELAPDCVLYSGHGPIWTVEEARSWWTQMKGWDAVF